MNAATMLGQSKTCYQAEIDLACELIDFWRFNVGFARQILAEQPISSPVWNRSDHRPLEGFVYAVTLFNFTAIAGNLPTAPALMGNTVVWKPAATQQFAASLVMELLIEAGLPPGVINMVTGTGIPVSEVTPGRPEPGRDPISPAPHQCSRCCGARWATTSATTVPTRGSWARPVVRTSSWSTPRPTRCRSPPRWSVVLLSSRDRNVRRRRAPTSPQRVERHPATRWRRPHRRTVDGYHPGLRQLHGSGDRPAGLRQAVRVQNRAGADGTVTVLAEAPPTTDRVLRPPTILECTDPTAEYFTTEYFGPPLAVHVFEDNDHHRVMDQMEGIAPTR